MGKSAIRLRQRVFLVLLAVVPASQGQDKSSVRLQVGPYACGSEVSGHVDLLAGDEHLPAGLTHRHCTDREGDPVVAVREGRHGHKVFEIRQESRGVFLEPIDSPEEAVASAYRLGHAITALYHSLRGECVYSNRPGYDVGCSGSFHDYLGAPEGRRNNQFRFGEDHEDSIELRRAEPGSE